MYYDRLDKESLKTEEEESNIVSLYQSKYNQLRLLNSFMCLYMNYCQNDETIIRKKRERENNVKEYQLISNQKNLIKRDKMKECEALQCKRNSIKTKYYKKFQILKTILMESKDIINDSDDIYFTSKLLSSFEVIRNNPFFSDETNELMEIIIDLSDDSDDSEFQMSDDESIIT